MKRGEQRRYAILGALHEHGEMNATQVCKVLRFSTGTIYADLAYLEEWYGLITKRQAIKDGDKLPRLYWRIANADERRGHHRRRLEEAAPVATPRRRMPLGTTWQPGGAW